MNVTKHKYDVVILGSGLAGLTLSRHLLRETDKTILVLDKSPDVPTTKQKYGESSVQVGGYYYSKVLDLETYLWHEQFMKYNLRFYFKTAGRSNTQFEDYAQAYIRTFSNIPCYQLDRNRFEADVLKMNQADSRFEMLHPVQNLAVELSESDRHTISYRHGDTDYSVSTEWVVDTTGRGRMLARQTDRRAPSPIDHGSAFMWVDGTVDLEKLTDRSPREIRLNKNRRETGHTPHWLATNHFMGEGFWFWVIPLRGMTSLGVVYDNALIDGKQFTSAEKLLDWICTEFPLFERDLRKRKTVDFNVLKSYAHGCTQTISSSKWAMSGEAGRFNDPLYSPGSDFIALHNTLIVDAVKCKSARKLARKCWLSEMLMQSCYNSLMPTFVTTYDALGDQETFVLKYTWELSAYFTFYVFPFINDLSCDSEFIPAYLSRFSRMGAMNQSVQSMISGYFQWKKDSPVVDAEPICHDFTALAPLARAEKMFYEVGVTPDEAKNILDEQLIGLTEFARFIVAYIHSIVLGDERIMTNRPFIEAIDFKTIEFDVEAMKAEWDRHSGSFEEFEWSFCPHALDKFRDQMSKRGHMAMEMMQTSES
ncbi:MAG: hypothetical protein O3A00_03120 [Planctomycetota bacterium]|nr:hypothetical protein [Planctomycetota bacterium]